MKWTFFLEDKTFRFRSPVFSRALGCGARSGAASTPRRLCRSRPGPVARALDVQSHEIWQVTMGVLPTSYMIRRANQAHVDSKNVSVCVFSLFSLPSRGITAVLQAFRVGPATSGASACGFVSVRMCRCTTDVPRSLQS